MAGDYVWKTGNSDHTYGELAALVAPVVNLTAEDVAEAIAIVFTADGRMLIAGTMCSDCIGKALIEAVVINQTAKAES